ncbi:hypothetical protein C8J56DRAFT_725284, partial [Mycena floridula]
ENTDHTANKNCVCNECSQDRNSRKCKDPHLCLITARDKLDTIAPKWDPRHPQQEPLAPPMVEITEDQIWDQDVTFPLSLTQGINEIKEGFRVLT